MSATSILLVLIYISLLRLMPGYVVEHTPVFSPLISVYLSSGESYSLRVAAVRRMVNDFPRQTYEYILARLSDEKGMEFDEYYNIIEVVRMLPNVDTEELAEIAFPNGGCRQCDVLFIKMMIERGVAPPVYLFKQFDSVVFSKDVELVTVMVNYWAEQKVISPLIDVGLKNIVKIYSEPVLLDAVLEYLKAIDSSSEDGQLEYLLGYFGGQSGYFTIRLYSYVSADRKRIRRHRSLIEALSRESNSLHYRKLLHSIK